MMGINLIQNLKESALHHMDMSPMDVITLSKLSRWKSALFLYCRDSDNVSAWDCLYASKLWYFFALQEMLCWYLPCCVLEMQLWPYFGCEKIQAGNFMIASSLLFSRNLYARVRLMFNFGNLQYFSSALFNLYQKLYIISAINKFWEQHQKQLWEQKAGKEVVQSGDGKNGSLVTWMISQSEFTK